MFDESPSLELRLFIEGMVVTDSWNFDVKFDYLPRPEGLSSPSVRPDGAEKRPDGAEKRPDGAEKRPGRHREKAGTAPRKDGTAPRNGLLFFRLLFFFFFLVLILSYKLTQCWWTNQSNI